MSCYVCSDHLVVTKEQFMEQWSEDEGEWEEWVRAHPMPNSEIRQQCPDCGGVGSWWMFPLCDCCTPYVLECSECGGTGIAPENPPRRTVDTTSTT